MYCRKCMKTDEKKINMEVDKEDQFYICPECGHVVDWNQDKEK